MKKTVLTIIQVLVTVGILFWVFHDPEKRHQMWIALSEIFHRPAGVSWLLAGFACYGIVEVLATVRWFVLLRVQGVQLPPWRVCALLMLGVFFNMFMPGGTGGDLMKVYFLIKEIPDKKKEGLLAVLMDRIIGLFGLIIVASFIVGMRYGWLGSAPESRHLTWVLLLILVASLGGIAFSFAVSGFRLINKLPSIVPPNVKEKLVEAADAYNVYAKAWPISLLALVLSFGVHFASFSVYICAARALNLGISDLQLLTLMPIILTLASLPISVGGAGVREGLFANLIPPLVVAVSAAQSVTLSLTGFMLTAAWGVIGGVIYLVYRPSDHRKMKEVAETVHQLEHEVAESDMQ